MYPSTLFSIDIVLFFNLKKFPDHWTLNGILYIFNNYVIGLRQVCWGSENICALQI